MTVARAVAVAVVAVAVAVAAVEVVVATLTILRASRTNKIYDATCITIPSFTYIYLTQHKYTAFFM